MNSGRKKYIAVIVIILIVIYVVWAIMRPVSPIKASLNSSLFKPTTLSSSLSWPTAGESAVSVAGSSILESHNLQTPIPTASTAKMITALMVLKAKPLNLGEQGPLVTLSANDVAIYNNYVNEQGSVVQVAAGEQISEYQMLEAMLLPSANNMADSLAVWAYGSLASYSSAANSYLKSLGINDTTVGVDASGFSPTTISTAVDLDKIGNLVMDNPVLKSIVAEKDASGIPIANVIKNVNYLLGTNNIIGIKTGNTNQAGGVYVSASNVAVGSKVITLITTDVGAPTLVQAVSGSLSFIKSAQANIKSVTELPKDTVIGQYVLPWNKQVLQIKLSNNLSGIVWNNGVLVTSIVNLDKLNKAEINGAVVGRFQLNGNAVIDSNNVDLIVSGSYTQPSVFWRLLHP